LDSNGSIERRTGSGQVSNARNDDAIKQVADGVQSQEERP